MSDGPIVQCKVTGSGVNYPCEPLAWCDPACAPDASVAHERSVAMVAEVLADPDLRRKDPDSLARLLLARLDQ
ncbi:MAG TPA: hypothetical protein VF244_10930 [Acidimicrobiales bacterium]